jgi:hypothetical protein
MSSFFLFIKYIFRVFHIGSFALIFGNLFVDYLFEQRSKTISATDRSNYVLLHISSSVLLMISGLVNMIILIYENKYAKNTSYTIWKYLLIFKFFMSLVLTPLLEKILPLNYFTEKNVNTLTIEDKSRIYFKVRVGVTLALFLISPLLRFLREYGMKPTKKFVKIE